MIFYPVKRPDGNRGREQIQSMVYFIGAGPGDPELLTIKGKKIIDRADVIIYAGSLVNPQVLASRKPEAVVYDSAGMHLDQVIAVMEQAEKEGLTTARVHTGDPAIYGAHREQMTGWRRWAFPMRSFRVSALFSGRQRRCMRSILCPA